jgi:hypothetical protein
VTLSDAAAMLTGSIGMLPSASLNANNQGLYEPFARLMTLPARALPILLATLERGNDAAVQL